MWKVLLAFVSHRVFIFCIALLAINSRISPERPGYTFKKLQPISLLTQEFLEKAKRGPEHTALQSALNIPALEGVKNNPNPFIWICRLFSFLPLTPIGVLILFSNLFFLLFLWELVSLINRMALPEVATGAAILALLWITSYELSLGSSLSLSVYLLTLALRQAIDNQWLVGGLALGVLGVQEPSMVGLLPFFVAVFWYYQRHFQINQVLTRLAYFAIPVGAVILWRWEAYRLISGSFQTSAMNQICLAVKLMDFGVLFSHAYLGQTLSLLFFIVGAIAAIVTNTTVLHRVLPVFTLIVLLLFSPYAAIGSRALLAAACLQGIAVVFSGTVTFIIQLGLVVLSAYEILNLF